MAINVSYTPAWNTILVTGGTELAPASFADIVTFDRAGTLELLGAIAGADNLTLTKQIRAVELRALKIDFVVAGKSAEVDYIHITGTDFRDNALQGTLDVSAGNGTYTTTKYFRTITDVYCNDSPINVGGVVWADGTVQVIQNQWGVVWDLGENTYVLDAYLYIGDSSTPTYFKDVNKVIIISDRSHQYVTFRRDFFRIYHYATVQLGELVDEATKQTCNGCIIHVQRTSAVSTNLFYPSGWSAAKCYLYGCTISTLNIPKTVTVYGERNYRFWNCSLVNYAFLRFYNDSDVYNVTLMGGSNPTELYYAYYFDYSSEPTLDGVKASNVDTAMRGYPSLATTKNAVANVITRAVYIGASTWNGEWKLLDCSFNKWIMKCQNGTGAILRAYTCNIHISDKDGVNLSGATVVCKDKDENEIFSVQTDVNGDIAEQEINYQRWQNLGPGDHGEGAAECFSPHTFIISKLGYETLTLENIVSNEKIEWHLELQDPVPVCDYPSVDDVEKDVVFDSGNKTGNFAAPAEEEVKKDVGYGANGTEFLGTLKVIGDLILTGNNLSAYLQRNVNLSAVLQPRVNLMGVLKRKPGLVGSLQLKLDIVGILRKKTGLVGEIEK